MCYIIFIHFTDIRKTCPCNVYPLKPHFYIAKLRYAEVYLFFLFWLQNIDLSKNKKNIKIFLMKFSFFFKTEKDLCILHGQVFVMS